MLKVWDEEEVEERQRLNTSSCLAYAPRIHTPTPSQKSRQARPWRARPSPAKAHQVACPNRVMGGGRWDEENSPEHFNPNSREKKRKNQHPKHRERKRKKKSKAVEASCGCLKLGVRKATFSRERSCSRDLRPKQNTACR
jgi:hypothetical protein